MNFYLTLIIYFLAGVIMDFFFTLNIRYVAKDKIILAFLTSFITTIISMIVLYSILTQLEGERSIIAIIIYALGIGIGTVIGMKIKISPKK